MVADLVADTSAANLVVSERVSSVVALGTDKMVVCGEAHQTNRIGMIEIRDLGGVGQDRENG